MKKLSNSVFVLALFFSFFAISCSSDNDDLDRHQENLKLLPAKVQAFVNKYFVDNYISEVSVSEDKNISIFYSNEKSNKVEVVFNKEGDWLKSTAEKSLPTTFLTCLPVDMQEVAGSLTETDTIQQASITSYGYNYLIHHKYMVRNRAYDNDGKYLGSDITKNILSPEDTMSDFIKKYWTDQSVVTYILEGYVLNVDPWLLYLSNDVVVKFSIPQGKEFGYDWQMIKSESPLSDEVLTLIPSTILGDLKKVSDSPVKTVQRSDDRIIYTFTLTDGKKYLFSL